MNFSLPLALVSVTASLVATTIGVFVLFNRLPGGGPEGNLFQAALITVPPHFVVGVILDSLRRIEQSLAEGKDRRAE